MGTRTAPRSPASPCSSSTRPRSHSVDPQTDQVTFKSDAGYLPAGRDRRHPGGRRPERGRQAGDRRRDERGVLRRQRHPNGRLQRLDDERPGARQVRLAPVGRAQLRQRCASTANQARRRSRRDSAGGQSPFVAGWPAKIGIALSELLPVIGEGITGSPVIANFACSARRRRRCRRREDRRHPGGARVSAQRRRQLLPRRRLRRQLQHAVRRIDGRWCRPGRPSGAARGGAARVRQPRRLEPSFMHAGYRDHPRP